MTRLPRTAVLVAGLLLLAAAPIGSARADTATEAQVEAQAAADRVQSLLPQVARALRRYDRALGALGSGISRSISAEQAADEAAALAAADRRSTDRRVRSLYMSGGSSALLVSVLGATDASDALRRVASVQRLVGFGAAAADAGSDRAGQLRSRAEVLALAAEASVVTAAQVSARYDELTVALAAASAELDRLSDRARELAAAQAAAATIARLNAAVAASGQDRVERARASATVPATFGRLYVAAADTCRGMQWPLLAAIGQVETGHGATTASSYAGAQGPMQFMPATFAAYGVDGDGDGDTDISDPADAVFSAARYLCANGAGRSAESTARAVWHYNHADWYVDLVLKLAGQYAERERP